MHVIGLRDRSALRKTTTNFEREAPEHGDARLVDPERVILSQGQVVARRFVEAFERRESRRVVGEQLAAAAEQLFATPNGAFEVVLRVVLVGQVDVAAERAERDRGFFAPGDVGHVVDGVGAPTKLEQERVELGEEGLARCALA